MNFKTVLLKNGCSTHNERNSVAAERFIRTLKNKIYRHMTSILKYVYIDKLDHIVNEYDNSYQRAIKMKPIDVKDNTYINTGKKKLMIKIQNLKLVIKKGCQNTKTFLLKAVLQVGQKKFL